MLLQYRAIKPLLLLFFCLLPLLGCEGINIWQATDAGKDAVKAITLSEEKVRELARQASSKADRDHRVAPQGSPYDHRLQRLVEEHGKEQGHSFNYKVYLSPKVNAFAMADGSIRLYSGLMDKMTDQELLFVLGHEMGHVVQDHVQEKLRLALAGSAMRKAIASQESMIGELAESQLGGLVQKLIHARFSRAEEEETDRYAVRFMQRHGYDPTKSITALKKLASLSKGHSILSTHPAPAARAKDIKKQLRSGTEHTKDTTWLGWILGFLQAIGGWLLDALVWLLNWIPGMDIQTGHALRA